MTKKSFAFLLFLIAAFTACQKELSNSTSALHASKTYAIKRGEPVLFSVETSDSITWRVSPPVGISIAASGNQAQIRFTYSGNFTVTAITGQDSVSVPVTVSDSVYDNPDSLPQGDTIHITGGCSTCPPPDTVYVPPVVHTDDTVRFAAGETLRLTAALYHGHDTTALIITARTTNSYLCGNNFLVQRFISAGGQYSLVYPGVQLPYGCSGDAQPAASREVFMFYPVSDGHHAVSVQMGTAVYTGSFTKSGDTYTFDWPHTSGVTITSLIVK